MRRTSAPGLGQGLALAVAAAVAVTATGACGGAGNGPRDVAITPPPAASPAGSTAAPPAEESGSVPSWAPPMREDHLEDLNGTAWLDEAVARELAKDCNWDPSGCIRAVASATYADQEGVYSPLDAACQEYVPLGCVAIPDQSCNPNPCSGDDVCYHECRNDCRDCGGDCAKRCTSCKASCKDDACRLACGRTCAVCRHQCVVELDHCTSAGCARWRKECYRDQVAAFAASTCGKVCDAVAKCVTKCPRKGENDWNYYRSDCAESCFSRLGQGCPETFKANCIGDPGRFFVPGDPADANPSE